MNKKELIARLEAIAAELLDISGQLTETEADFFSGGGVAAAAYMICGIIDGMD